MSLSMTVGLVCLVGLVVIFVAKIINILKLRKREKQLYEMDLVLIGIFLSLFFWGCYLGAMSSSLVAVDTITTDTGVITVSYGDFYDLQIYYWLVVFLFVMNLFMGIVEASSRIEFFVKEYTGD